MVYKLDINTNRLNVKSFASQNSFLPPTHHLTRPKFSKSQSVLQAQSICLSFLWWKDWKLYLQGYQQSWILWYLFGVSLHGPAPGIMRLCEKLSFWKKSKSLALTIAKKNLKIKWINGKGSGKKQMEKIIQNGYCHWLQWSPVLIHYFKLITFKPVSWFWQAWLIIFYYLWLESLVFEGLFNSAIWLAWEFLCGLMPPGLQRYILHI